MNTRIPASRRTHHGFAAAAAAAACATSASAQIEYEFFLVDAWNTSYNLRECYVTEINEHNMASGGATGASSFGGFIWIEATEKQAIPVSSPKGLNNFGVVVDNNFVYDTVSATSTTVDSLSGFNVARLRDVNDAGIVVGYSWAGTNCSQPYCFAPQIWDAVNGSRTISNVPNARTLRRINNAGQVLGHIAAVTMDRTEAFVYDLNTSTWINLGEGLPPQWLAGHPITSAIDISEAGSVIGIAEWGQGPPRAFLWKPGVGRTYLPGLGPGDPDRVAPNGVNSSNVVVGAAPNAPTSGSFEWHAFIWDEVNGMRNLNDLVTPPTGFILNDAYKINDNGWIVGSGHFGPGWATQRGYVLKPINQTPACYANCDQSAIQPVLNVDDFTCFINEYAQAQSLPHAQQVEHYANCDNSTVAPALNVDDFTCFINAFAAGCP